MFLNDEREPGVFRAVRRLHERALGVLSAGVGRGDDRDSFPVLAVEVAQRGGRRSSVLTLDENV